MASDYFVRFVINLDPNKILPDVKNPVYHDIIFQQVANFESLKDTIDAAAVQIIKLGGVVVMKNSSKPYAPDVDTLSLRVFIPIHMVTSIEMEVKRLTGQITPADGIQEQIN